MRPNCDVLVVSCHWGVEGNHDVEDSQRQMAQWLADHDVDLIIGTHPHVTQTAEWLTGAEGHTSFVAYSLGNFLNAQSSPCLLYTSLPHIHAQEYQTERGNQHGTEGV